MIQCRLCGKTPTDCQDVLHRVNEKGATGIWECRPICGAEMNNDEAILAAIAGVFDEPRSDKGKHVAGVLQEDVDEAEN